MRISKKAEYAIRALLAIAGAPAGQPLQIQELASSEKIPNKFLEQILLELKRAGILQSKRGAGGGYFLHKPANTISIGEIIELIDGPLAIIEEEPAAERSTHCLALCQFMKAVEHNLRAQLQERSIEELLADESPLAYEI